MTDFIDDTLLWRGNRKGGGLFLSLLLLLLLAGCAKSPKIADVGKGGTPPATAAEKSLSPNLSSSLPETLPTELPSTPSFQETTPVVALPASPTISLPGKAEKRYFLRVRDADIEEVLLSFSKDTNVNFLIDSDISGQITVDLKNVTLKEALDALLLSLGMKYEKKGNFVRVYKPKAVTRMFILNYITSTRTGNTRVTFNSGSKGGQSSLNDTTKYDLWKSLKDGIEKILSKEGWSMVDMDSGIIMIHDLPDIIETIAEYLEIVEGSINRQVMIETRIIEVTLNDQLQTGIDWSLLGSGVKNLKGALPGGALLQQNTQIPTGTLQMGVATLDYSLFLNALSKQGTLNVLSKPSIAVLNNQKAAIMVGTEEIYYEKETQTTEFTTTTTFKAVPYNVGISLDVTPQINPKGFVTVSIHPSITDKTGESISPDGELITPIINIIETSTVLNVRDGQTVVIGGLMREKYIDTKQSVPLLGKIPILGRLFRSDSREATKSEMVVMITPTVLTSVKIEQASQAQYEKFKKLRKELLN